MTKTLFTSTDVKFGKAAPAAKLTSTNTVSYTHLDVYKRQEHITVTYADGTAPSADYSETFFNVLPDDSYGALTFSACTDKGNAASFTITRSTPVVANWVYTVEPVSYTHLISSPTPAASCRSWDRRYGSSASLRWCRWSSRG